MKKKLDFVSKTGRSPGEYKMTNQWTWPVRPREIVEEV